VLGAADEQEAEHDERAQHVARDHDGAAAHEVGDDAGERPQHDGRHEARDEHEADGAARLRQLQHERVDGDGVEPVAELADDLPEPQLSEVAVAPQQLRVTDTRAFSESCHGQKFIAGKGNKNC
jgi:hypothetical protein